MLYILRKLVKERAFWKSTYIKTWYENFYETASDIELDQIKDIVSNWIYESEVVEMCNSQLLTALENIATTIRLSSCCFEGGPGQQQIGDDIYWGSEPAESEPTAFGPGEEFETQAAWELHKCEVANGIVNGLIGSLNGFSVLTLVTLIASSVLAAVVGIGLIFVPPLAIIAAIVGTGLAFSFFSTLANEIEDNKTSIVCAIYNSQTAQDAYNELSDALDVISVDLGLLEIQAAYVKDLIMQMAPIDTFNKLYNNVGLPAVGGTTVDCDTECGVCPEYHIYNGTYDPVTGNIDSEFNAASNPDREQVYIFFSYADGVGFCGDAVTLTVTEVSGTPDDRYNNPTGYRIYNQSGGLLYQHQNAPPSSPLANVGYMIAYNNIGSPPAAFTLNITWT
jgi:hypothetical protein